MQTTDSQTALILRDLSKGRPVKARKALILELQNQGYPIIRQGNEYSLPAGTIVVDNLQKAS